MNRVIRDFVSLFPIQSMNDSGEEKKINRREEKNNVERIEEEN